MKREKSERFTIYLPAEVIPRLDALANQMGIARSTWARMVIVKAIRASERTIIHERIADAVGPGAPPEDPAKPAAPSIFNP